jgi:hypothetical protein
LDKDLFISSGPGGERALGRGQRPWLASGPKGSYIVYEQGGKVLLSGPGGPPTVISESGRFPVAAGHVDHGGVVVWEFSEGIRAAFVFAKR